MIKKLLMAVMAIGILAGVAARLFRRREYRICTRWEWQ